MVSALLFTIIGVIIIFVHKKGWSKVSLASGLTSTSAMFLEIRSLLTIFTSSFCMKRNKYKYKASWEGDIVDHYGGDVTFSLARGWLYGRR